MRSGQMLANRLSSVFQSGNDLLSGLSTKLEAALNLSIPDEEQAGQGQGDDSCPTSDEEGETESRTSSNTTTTTADKPPTIFKRKSCQNRIGLGHSLSSTTTSTSGIVDDSSGVLDQDSSDGAGSGRQKSALMSVNAAGKNRQQKTNLLELEAAISADEPYYFQASLHPKTSWRMRKKLSYHHHRTKKRKDRSVYGQPEVTEDELGASRKEKIAAITPANNKDEQPSEVVVEGVVSGSESELDCGTGVSMSTSLDSSDCEQIIKDGGVSYYCGAVGSTIPNRSGSESSLRSWSSSFSWDSQPDESTADCMEFMKKFVDDLFSGKCTSIGIERKAIFGELCRTESGRIWFARYVNMQRVGRKCVDESTFYSLIQYFAIVLFECAEADDFSPAKSLMNMCFTFYHEVAVPGCEPYRELLFTYLKDQPIWHSLRFWNAAYFDAVQCERAQRGPNPTREDYDGYSADELCNDRQFQENIAFGQLGTFTCNMHAFGLNKELCLDFLRKQSTIANLKPDQVTMLQSNIERMYRETCKWR